jgi:hypothetical protein
MRKASVVLAAAAVLGLGVVSESSTAEARGRHGYGGQLFVVASGYAYGPSYYGSGPGFGAYVPPSYYAAYYYDRSFPAYYGCRYRRAVTPACVY